MLGLNFSSKLDWGSYIISIAKSARKKIGVLIRSMKFLSPRSLYISINLPNTHVWNTVVTTELVPPLLVGIVRQATKTDMQDCWPFIYCFS